MYISKKVREVDYNMNDQPICEQVTTSRLILFWTRNILSTRDIEMLSTRDQKLKAKVLCLNCFGYRIRKSTKTRM